MHKQGRKHGQKPGRFNAYSDGSVFNGGCNAGAGWVIHPVGGPVDGKESSRLCSRRIGESSRVTSTLAEIYAAAAALNDIPPGSIVTLHSDDLDLVNVMRYQGLLGARIARNHAKPDLQRSYVSLYNAMARHAVVTPVKTVVEVCPSLKKAHHLAREGAFAFPQCDIPVPAPL